MVRLDADLKCSKMKKCELICVIVGKDDSLVSGECEKLVEQLLEPEQRSVGLFRVEANKVSITEVLDELRTVPFLTDKRVVVIKRADDFVSQNRQLLERYFDAPCATGRLILTVSSWSAQTKLAKKLLRVGRLISIEQVKAWQLPGRLIEYAGQAQGKRLTTDAAELLIELVGDSLGKLYSEVDKLALFVQGQKQITARDVELLTGQGRLFNSFAVIDACLAGDVGRALERLRNMFAEDRTAQFSVVGAFAFHLRRQFTAKVLLDKGADRGEVASRLRIWGDKNAFFAQLQQMTLKQIGAGLQQLAAVDYAIKTGRSQAEVAAEQFVLGLARPVR